MAFLPRHAVSRDFEITSLIITTWLYLLGWTPAPGAAKMAIAKNETPGELPARWPRCRPEQERSTGNPQHPAGMLRWSCKKKGARHDWPEPPSIPGLIQTAVRQRLIKRCVAQIALFKDIDRQIQLNGC